MGFTIAFFQKMEKKISDFAKRTPKNCPYDQEQGHTGNLTKKQLFDSLHEWRESASSWKTDKQRAKSLAQWPEGEIKAGMYPLSRTTLIFRGVRRYPVWYTDRVLPIRRIVQRWGATRAPGRVCGMQCAMHCPLLKGAATASWKQKR